ncbi:MAG: aminoacyl-tRNA hydrolase, partial [Spirochaetaceae bacterium]
VNTRVTLRIPVSKLDLSEGESVRVRSILTNRINLEGELVIHCGETRSREKNRGLALSRAVELIDSARRPVRRRRATRPSRAAREKRLTQKRLTSRRKLDRRGPGEE